MRAATVLPDLTDSPGAVREQVLDLRSPDEARARRAEIRLGCAGAAALDALEAADGGSSPRMRARLERIIDLALRTTVTEADLRRHPGLFRLARPRLEAAERLADSLATRHAVGTLIARGGDGHDPNGDRRLIACGGYAVPKAVRMLRDPRAIARVVGIQTIYGTYAVVASGELEALRNSTDPFGTDEDCYVAPHTIGEFAADTHRRLEEFWSPWLGYEWPITCLCKHFGGDIVYDDLIDGIRSSSSDLAGRAEGGSMSAKNWNEWWTRAWPAWRDWWDMSDASGKPRDIGEYENALSEYRGYRLARALSDSGTSVLEVLGPREVDVEVMEFDQAGDDSLELLHGSPPLASRVSRDSALALGWEIPEKEWDATGTTRVRVRLRDGRQWEEQFASFAGFRWRLEILDPPRRADHRLR